MEMFVAEFYSKMSQFKENILLSFPLCYTILISLAFYDGLEPHQHTLPIKFFQQHPAIIKLCQNNFCLIKLDTRARIVK